MAYEFKLPDLGEGLTEGEIARWLVAEGQEVAEDDPLVEIQTDKTTVEIPSPAAGKVARILVAEGEVVPVGTVLVVIGDGAGREPVATEARPRPARSARPRASVRATPLVRRIAQELGVDLATVTGTGPRAGSPRRDVAARPAGTAAARAGGTARAAARRPPADRRAHGASAPRGAAGDLGRGVRLRAARPARAARAGRAEGGRALSLQEYPELNARLEGDEIVYLDRYDLGVAVQTEQGLVVPVVPRLRLELDRRARRRGRAASPTAPAPGSSRPRSCADRPSRSRAPASSAASSTRRSSTTPRWRSSASAGSRRAPSCGTARSSSGRSGTIAVTFDHRVIDGARAAEFGLAVIRRLESPAAPWLGAISPGSRCARASARSAAR